MGKRQVLQLAVDLVQPEPVRDGGVDIQRLDRGAAPFAARHIGQRTHVV